MGTVHFAGEIVHFAVEIVHFAVGTVQVAEETDLGLAVAIVDVEDAEAIDLVVETGPGVEETCLDWETFLAAEGIDH